MVDGGMDTWEDKESKEILRNILMTACDIASITKPWEIQRKVSGDISCKTKDYRVCKTLGYMKLNVRIMCCV